MSARHIESSTLFEDKTKLVQSLVYHSERDKSFLYARRIFIHKNKKSKKVKTIIFLHDIGEHSARYYDELELFSKKLNTNIQIVAIDLFGHGRSSGTRGHIESLDDQCLELIHLINLCKQQINANEVFFMCQGLGAILALKCVHLYFSHFNFNVEGLILLNPAFKWRWNAPGFMEVLHSDHLDFLKKVKVPFQITGQLVAGSSEQAQSYNSDPLVNHRMSWNTFHQVQKSASFIRTSAYYLDIPVFMGLSAKDSLYDHGISELFCRGIEKKVLKVYESSEHDLIHGLDRENLIKDMYNWFKDNFKSGRT